MSSVDELARNAAKLPDDQKLALANRILEQAEASKTSEIDAIWDQEIRNRVRAYDETRPSTRAASDVFSDLDSKLSNDSTLWRMREGGYRRVNCPVFPYFIAYIVRDDQVVIVAVAHAHRRPDYWVEA